MTDLKVIHKRVLNTTAQVVRLPLGSEIVGFAAQGSDLCMWYSRPQPDDTNTYDEWQLIIVGTGHPYENQYHYLAGPALVDGFVFHLVGKYLGAGRN